MEQIGFGSSLGSVDVLAEAQPLDDLDGEAQIFGLSVETLAGGGACRKTGGDHGREKCRTESGLIHRLRVWERKKAGKCPRSFAGQYSGT
jgi:hypothetical protein